MSTKLVTLASLPTLRSLYGNGTLTAAATTRYPAVTSYLDRISLFQGDITKVEVDAIVNAANSSLLGGGGVDGAIHAAAGPKLLQECRTLHGCDTGDAKITKGYNLPSKYIVHAVGPVYSTKNVELKASQLSSCYQKSLKLVVENSLKHIAFPSISTGVYGYPIENATHIALNETRLFLGSDLGDQIDCVIFVVFGNRDKSVYEELLPEYFPSA